MMCIKLAQIKIIVSLIVGFGIGIAFRIARHLTSVLIRLLIIIPIVAIKHVLTVIVVHVVID